MRLLGLIVGRDLQKRQAEASPSQFTYPHVGSTMSGVVPRGVTVDDGERYLGSGRIVFEAAKRALRAWAPQSAIGARTSLPRVPEQGDTVILGLGPGPIRLIVPVRLVRVIDEERRWGFAYGTLEGHAESGEELFVIDWRDTDQVWFRVVAHSRPSPRWRWAAPVLRALQLRSFATYLDSIPAADPDDPASSASRDPM